MKKIILLAMTIVGSIFAVSSSPVDTTLAKTVAVNFYIQNLPPQSVSLMNNINAYMAYTKVANNTDIFYVYNISNNNGWVMVAADNAINPILAYAQEGSYSSMDQPPAFVDWINSYKDAILYVKQNNIVANTLVSNKWNRLINNTGNLKVLLTSVSPLLSTTWNQGCYYNALCPADAGGPCSHVYTGCVATALAQIMKYWNYPVTGTGSHSYTDPTYGTQSANFGATTYNWGSMPNNVTSANSAVATLMYHCGVSVDMEYGISGSAANTSDVPYALINYFGYQNTATYVCRSSYSDNDWINLLKSELDQSRPVQYRGSGPDGGHSFVCDGYDNNSYFHFNWGWGGSSDGYFAIGDLTPGSYDFNTGNCAVIYIKPPCPANQTITGTTPLCPGASATWSSTTSGGLWSSSATAVATINSSTGLVTGISAGSTVITYNLTLYGCTKTATKTLTINPAAVITSVSGTSPLCPGNSATYTASGLVLGGGTGAWSSSNTTVATVVASTGIVTAVASGGGTANIIYTITGGCGGTKSAQQTLMVTPNAAVGPVSGTSPLCIGAGATYTVNSVILGGGTGAWSSSNTTMATVAASTGIVTAVASGGGTANIIYTVTGGCGGTKSAQQTLTIIPNAAVASVTGATPLSPGNTAAYAATGVVLGGGAGAWSSSNTSVATVTSTGMVTAIDSGSVNIIYTITGGCGGTTSAKKSLIVAPNAEYVLVIGGGSQCGGSRTLTATTSANGTIYWQGTTAGGTSTATATSSQTVTSSGTYYFRPLSEYGWGAEGSATVVIDSAVVQTIYGPDSVNIGSTAIWTVTTAGGTWSSSVPAVASVDSATGLITGVSAGTALITYIVNTGVCVNTASKSIIVSDSSANNSTTTAVIIYSGFQACGGCTVCGSDYWCTNTPGSYCGDTPPCTTNTFFDPVPAGNIVSGITINYWTASCNGALLYGTLNGFTVPVATDGSTGCLCSDSICDLTTSVTLSYPCGVPGYVYGGYNSFQLCSSDAMCINRTEFIISYYPASQAPEIPGAVTVTGGGTFCNSALLAASGGTDGTIYWQGTSSLGTSTALPVSSYTVSASGTYYFRAYSQDGCWGPPGSATVTINNVPGSITVSGGGSVCSGNTRVLNASGGTNGTIYWQGTVSSGTSTASASASQTVSSAGIYYFRAKNSCGWGVQGSATITIITALPGAVAVTGGGTFCGSKVITASGGTGGTVYWQGTTSGGTSTATPSTSRTVTTSGTYYFRPFNDCGWGTEGSVTVTNSSPGSVTVSGGGTLCSGGSMTLTASGGTGGTIYWQGTSSSGTSTATPATSKTVTANGIYYFRAYNNICWGSAVGKSVVLAIPGNLTVSGGGTALCSKVLLASGGTGGTIYWQGTTSGGTSTSSPATNRTVTTSGTYYFRAYNACGWGTQSSVSVTINPAVNVVLTSDSPVITSTYPTYYQYQNNTNMTAVVAIAPETEDHDISINSQYCGLGSALASSVNVSTIVDFAICYYGNQSTLYPIAQYGSSGESIVEYEAGTGLNICNAVSGNMQTSEAVDMYEVFLTSGVSYDVLLDITTGSCNLGFALGYTTSFLSRNSCALVTDANGASGDESVTGWNCPVSGYYGLVVFNTYTGNAASDYTIKICATPGHVTVIGGGTYCTNATITATGGYGGTIYWQGTTANGTSTATPATSRNITASGTYYFRAFNGISWGAQGSAIVTINPLPPNPSPSASPAVICHGSSSNLTASVNGAIIYWYSGSCSGNQIGIGDTISVTPDATNTYYARAYYDTTGCWSAGCGDVAISVSLIPIADAGTDTTFTGTPVQIGSPLNGPGTIIWMPAAGLSNPTIAQPLASPSVTTTYTLTVNNNGCVATDEVTVQYVNPTHSISGKTMYMGRAYNGSPAPNPPTYNPAIYTIDRVIVLLKTYPSGTELARDTSDASGNYHFSDVPDGNYLLSYDKYTADTMQWGNDINVADVSMLKYLIASDTLQDPSRCFSSKYRKAGNVDNNLSLNVIDVSRIKSKIASPYMVEKNFPKGNWVALDKTVTVSGADVNINLETVCYGDYNASSIRYRDSLITWNGLKSLPTEIIVTTDEYLTTVGPSYIEIPLRISVKMDDFSALGLELTYPSDGYKLVNVTIPKAVHKTANLKINPTLEEIINEDNDLLVTDEDGVIRVVYATTDHFDVAAGEEIIKLGFRSFKTIKQGELSFELSGTGIIANKYGGENEEAYLLVPKLFVQGNDYDEGFEFSAYPNPFNDEAILNYSIPENGVVKLTVYNALGELVSELVNAEQIGGKHSALFSPAHLPAGVYTCRLEFVGREKAKSLVLKLIH